MDLSRSDTALLLTDPQNDFLSEQGVTWGLVGESVRENGMVENIEKCSSPPKRTATRKR